MKKLILIVCNGNMHRSVIADLYGQKDPAVVRREILRIDAIIKTRITQVVALAELLTIQRERK